MASFVGITQQLDVYRHSASYSFFSLLPFCKDLNCLQSVCTVDCTTALLAVVHVFFIYIKTRRQTLTVACVGGSGNDCGDFRGSMASHAFSLIGWSGAASSLHLLLTIHQLEKQKNNNLELKIKFENLLQNVAEERVKKHIKIYC